MIRSIMVMLLLAGSALAAAQDAPRPSPETLSQQARAAREARDYPGYLKAIEALRDMLPWSPVIRYNMVRAYALNGRKAEAIATLVSLADAGWGFDAAGDAVLAPLHGDPAFKAVAARLAANGQPRGQVAPSRELDLAGKQPEGVAATADGTVYVGALREGIHRVEVSGLKRLYAPGGAWGIVGLRVDAPRGELIACVSDEAAGKARIVRLALPDLQPRASVDIPAAGAFCNDSAVLPDGRVAVTDSTGGRLWIADRTAIVEVKTDKPLVYPNGVAFGGGRLYVAHAGGLLVVEPATGATQEVKAGATSLVGIDGLTWRDGSLLAVQNGTQPIRILRITPPAELSNDARIELLASGHPELNGATTAAAVGDRLLVLTQTGIPNGSQPDDPMLVAVPLGR
jgi:hypothetical protein